MKIKLLFVGLLSVFALSVAAQDNGNHVVKKSPQKTSYSYEKKINGVTVFYFTPEQYDRLPEKRKSYFNEHKECFQIIKPKH